MREPREFSYPSSDGNHTVHAMEWLPQGQPRAVVQIVHGVAEYVGRYDHVARFLTERGFLVCGEDHLGHGKTVDDGKYGYFGPRGGWDLVVRDIRRLRELQGEKYPGVPYVMLGHSMGSFLTRTYLIRWPGTVDGAVLSGTGQEPAPLVALGKALAGGLCLLRGGDSVSPLVNAMSLGAYNKKFAPNRTGADWISRDEAVVDAYLKDPLCTFMPTVAMFRDMMGGLQYIADRNNLARMDKETPVYFLSGDRDPVGAMGKGVEKVVRMFRKAGCRDVSVKLYPEGRHEMFNELNRDEVMADLLAWLESKL
ncbi:alpha/beta hydrolase [Pseudoflavonifractor phocaeensis]|uniref:alpha/beta hydrolase n=1 Tax=Pseudoflavonifractor phocaeensis TaxID=1870988 RepID=UPI001F380660|nr:alpha/beta hydrolase [Pseudoflavonifractor phocaeensis]MCF2596748.1 lysophospholipase [Pseudoflavonifractor phocaeensis]